MFLNKFSLQNSFFMSNLDISETNYLQLKLKNTSEIALEQT